jgi:hypothetical protein
MTQRKTQPQHALGLFERLDREMWLAKRLGQHGAVVFDGDTDTAERKLRFRQAIQLHGLDLVVVGMSKTTHKPLTYSDVFRELYGERL